MKRSAPIFLCLFAPLFLCLFNARAQWVIDGKQTQVLRFEVSDPQAIYPDGSRQMTAPLVFSSSMASTSGLMRATIPWDPGEFDFFILNETEETLRLSSSGNISFQVGGLVINQAGLYQTAEGTSVQFGEHLLSGGWMIDQVLPYPEAIINRGYADTRYLLRSTGITTNRVIQAGNTLVISNGLITAILP